LNDFFCVWASFGNFPKRKSCLFSPLANHLRRFQLGRLGNPPTSSPRSPPPSSPAMPTPVAASRISTWVFSTKIYTNKFIFVTKLGLGLVRVLLKEYILFLCHWNAQNCLASCRIEAIDKDAIYRSG
ncbi:unnamed protein product, partial [Prunus brigantina]